MKSWDQFFIDLAYLWAERSKDPNKKVGAVVADEEHHLLGCGYNGFPHGVEDNEMWLSDRELKNKLMIHAEDNAVRDAERKNSGEFTCTLYVNEPVCVQCAMRIIRSDMFVRVVQPSLDETSNWYRDCMLAVNMLNLAGISVENYDA